MNKNTVIALFLLLVLSGCGSEHPLKLGYEGASYDDQEIHEAVKNELDKGLIDYYTYIDDGRKVIAYRKEDKDRVNSIFREVTGGPPEGYTGLCYETMASAKKQQQQLENNQIPSVMRERNSTYCVYWEKENSDRVAEIDQHFKEIRAHQKQMGNEI